MNQPMLHADHVDRALVEACRRAHAEILDFTIAPRATTPAEPWDGYDWLIEFADPPRAPERFRSVLDDALCRLDPAYRARRRVDGSMAPPRVLEVPAGTFHRWRSVTGSDVPHMCGTRLVVETVLVVASGTRLPLIEVG